MGKLRDIAIKIIKELFKWLRIAVIYALCIIVPFILACIALIVMKDWDYIIEFIKNL